MTDVMELVVVIGLVAGAGLWLVVRWVRSWRRLTTPASPHPGCASCPFGDAASEATCAACGMNPSLGAGVRSASAPETVPGVPWAQTEDGGGARDAGTSVGDTGAAAEGVNPRSKA